MATRVTTSSASPISRSRETARTAGRKLRSRSTSSLPRGRNIATTPSDVTTAAATRNVVSIPASDAPRPPISGPAIMPIVAAELAIPIVRPRRSTGVDSASQARPALQVIAEARPWAKRPASSAP